MEVIINNNLFKVKPLLTSKDIQKGMMFKKFNHNFDGMLFFMDEGPKSFWMKNCIISLDIIFINNGIINNIKHSCEPCRKKNCPSYKGYGDMVLEVEGGTCEKYNIKKGDEVKFN